MYISRHVDRVLELWWRDPGRKPLILRGARQTGKTTTIREFGRKCTVFLELNLEKRADRAMVQSSTDTNDLLAALATRHNLASFPANTLLFIDEIQESPEAVQWLRFFKEEHPGLGVIAAGSLLEVRLQERGFSFPVGRVTFRTMRPLSYLEFLRAVDKDVLAARLVDDLLALRPSPPPLHDQALLLLRDHLLVGGMPEAVMKWVETGLIGTVRRVHADLMQALAEDFQKYRGVREAGLDHLEAAFVNAKHHHGQRFKYENFAPGFKSRAMNTAIGRLEGAMLMSRVWPTSSFETPCRIRSRAAPKLLPLDTGLALHELGMSPDVLRSLPLERVLDGRLAEMFVGLQLQVEQPRRQDLLYFWVRDSSRGGAEVDYLLPSGRKLIPLEVKSGLQGTLKSLHQFLRRSGRSLGIRLCPREFSLEDASVRTHDGELEYRLMTIPLYLAEKVGDLLENKSLFDADPD